MNRNLLKKETLTVVDWLREGSLTPRQLMGIDDKEMYALAETANTYRRKGQLNSALEIVSVLAKIDPYRATWWRMLASLHKSQGGYAEAVVCFEAAAICGQRNPESTRQEFACLKRLGETALQEEMCRELKKLEEIG